MFGLIYQVIFNEITLQVVIRLIPFKIDIRNNISIIVSTTAFSLLYQLRRREDIHSVTDYYFGERREYEYWNNH